MAKSFYKVCKAYHTFFEGYQVPKGACYGRSVINNEEIFWVCSDYSGLKTGLLHVSFMKRAWLVNSNCKIQHTTWHTMIVPKSHAIYVQIYSLLKTLGGIPKVTTYEPQRKNKLSVSDKKTIGMRMPQSEYNIKCGRTHSVDNADQSHVISNYNSYWAIKKDVVRNVSNYGGNIY